MRSKDREEILRVIGPYLSDPHILEMKDYIQHGEITTYRHVINVVKMAYILDKKMHVGADREVFLVAALLHDFYLYDWHKRPMFDFHGYRHPARAAANASRIFHVDRAVHEAILTHMWPLTWFKRPKTREAWIVCMADKLSSMAETLWMRG